VSIAFIKSQHILTSLLCFVKDLRNSPTWTVMTILIIIVTSLQN